jgi:hypothetical protein
MAYDNTNRGSIWKNKKKEKDTHPDFTGSINVEGVEYWVNAWRRKDDAKPDAPALTFTVRPKEAKADHQNEKPKRQTGGMSDGLRPDMDDELFMEWRG